MEFDDARAASILESLTKLLESIAEEDLVPPPGPFIPHPLMPIVGIITAHRVDLKRLVIWRERIANDLDGLGKEMVEARLKPSADYQALLDRLRIAQLLKQRFTIAFEAAFLEAFPDLPQDTTDIHIIIAPGWRVGFVMKSAIARLRLEARLKFFAGGGVLTDFPGTVQALDTLSKT